MSKILPSISSLALLTALGTAGAQGIPAHPKADAGVPRDKNGHVKRSSTAKEEFERKTGYPHGRPGYVIDHIIPLAKGGRDDPSNMQWQTKAEAKAKDRVELGQHPKTSHSSSAIPKPTHIGGTTRGGFGSSARSTHS